MSAYLMCAIVCIGLAPGAAYADRASVEQALAEMERAVLAGDGAAYLALVDKSDANFAKEQENWAADLKRHVPTEFALRVAEDGGKESERAAAEFGDREAKFELAMEWTMKGLGRGGKDVHKNVSFPAKFVLDDAGGKWLFAGEDWLVMEEPKGKSGAGVRVYYYAGYEEAARNIVDVLPAVREHVDAGFEVKIDRVQEVKVYPAMAHLQASIYLSYVDGLSGWNEPGEAIKLRVKPDAAAAMMRSLLAHEYGHVATFEKGPKATDMPWWVLEGVAELAAEEYAKNGEKVKTRVRGWMEADTLAPWEEISDFRNTPKKWGGHVYTQGHSMLGYVSEKYGRAKRNAWLTAMGHGKTIDEASHEVFGAGFEEVDAGWRKWLGEGKEAETPMRDADQTMPKSTPKPE